MPTTDDIVRQLYEAPPDGFVAARAAAVAGARAAGDRDTAKRLAALKKPTVAAWVVNLLALRRPELIDELAELSAALRAAQRDLRGEQMRELSLQRRRFVTSLVDAARRLAVSAGATRAKLPLDEVEATFTAALAEPEIATQVRTGRLIRAATYAGFGEVPRPRLRLVTDDDPGTAADPAEPSAEPSAPNTDRTAADQRRPAYSADGERRSEGGAAERRRPAESAAEQRRREQSAGEQRRREESAAEQRRREREQQVARRRRELEREMKAAEASEKRADDQLQRAEDAERDAEHLVEDLEAELAELERRRTEAVADVARRKQARRTAEREAAAARRRVGDAQAALDDLR